MAEKDSAGSGLSLVKFNRIQVLRSYLLVQFIRWLQKSQLRHSHGAKGTVYVFWKQ